MMHRAVAIANSFWDIAQTAGQSVDPMKLQKLVYFAHGWHLGFGEGPLSIDNAEAWRWGPVFPDLYRAVKRWGSGVIREPIHVVEFNGTELGWQAPKMSEQDEPGHRLVERVWHVYWKMSGPALSRLTHEEDGPWHQTWSKVLEGRSTVIPDEIIEKHFRQKIEANAT